MYLRGSNRIRTLRASISSRSFFAICAYISFPVVFVCVCVCVSSFLRARRFDVAKAKAMIISAEQWREDFGIEDLMK
jgi:hypothetical protein